MATEDLTPEEQAAFDEQRQASTEPVEESHGESDDQQTPPEPEERTEAQEDVPPEEDKAKPPKGHVPLEALHEERQRRQQLQSQLEQTNQRVEQLSQLEQEMREYRERARQKQEQFDAEKSYQDDPVGYLKHQNEQLQQRISEIDQGINQQSQAYQQQQEQAKQVQQLAQAVRSQEDEFRQQAPDYDEAFNYIQNAAMEDYDLYGLNDPQQKQQQFYQQVMAISLQALQAGRNPAEIIYTMAKRRGYQGNQGGGQAEQKVENVKRGQAASTTLSQGGASGPHNSEISMSDVEKMSDDEFDKFWDKMRKDNKAGRG